MNLIDSLPPELRRFIAASRSGFSPLSMTILFLQKNCDIEQTLKAAAQTELNWQRGLEKHRRRLEEAKVEKERKKETRTEQKLAEIRAFLLS